MSRRRSIPGFIDWSQGPLIAASAGCSVLTTAYLTVFRHKALLVRSQRAAIWYCQRLCHSFGDVSGLFGFPGLYMSMVIFALALKVDLG